jgi:hypothetical protein
VTRSPNPRLQRTPSASPPSPLSRQPLGARKLGRGGIAAALGLVATCCSNQERSHHERIPDHLSVARIQSTVRHLVPPGSDLAGARELMKREGFHCSVLARGKSNDHADDNRLLCSREESAGWPVIRSWRVTFVYVGQTVTKISCEDGLIGP